MLRMGIHAYAMGEGRIRREPQRGDRERCINIEVPTAVSEVKRPLRNRFGSETVINLKRLYATAIPQRIKVPVRV